MIFNIIILLFVLSVGGFSDNQGKIIGRVVDSEDQSPLDGAIVEVLHTDKKVLTDEQGEFEIGGVPIGEYDLLIRAVRYRPLTLKRVRVNSERETYLTLRPVKYDLEKRLKVEVPKSRDLTMKYHIKIVKPGALRDCKILVVKPNPDIDYKILISEPMKKGK